MKIMLKSAAPILSFSKIALVKWIEVEDQKSRTYDENSISKIWPDCNDSYKE